MANSNLVELQRYRWDTGQWETIQYRYTYYGGTLSDHYFDTYDWRPWGSANYRIVVSDNNNNALGVSSILATTMSR